MVQAGATVSYHNPMDEQPEPSWTTAIRSAVKEFVDAVNESSKQLAGASERFAVDSLQAMDAARMRSEQSAETSAEMARQAREAAEVARSATSSLQAAVEQAKEQVRNEAHQTVEQVATQTARINEIGAQVKYDLQQRIDEMVARLEAGTAGHNEAMETANAATAAAQAAAQRIETSVNAVEAAVSSARRAAEEARTAADHSEKNLSGASEAVATAQEAAEASRQSASLAEQAGKRSDFAAEASILLERLETDYALLTRLVQELHSRISGLSAVSMAPPAPAHEPPAESPASELEPPIEAYEPEPEVAPRWNEPEFESLESRRVESMVEADLPQAFDPQPLEDMVEPMLLQTYATEPVEEVVEPTPLQAYTRQPVEPPIEPFEDTTEVQDTYASEPVDSLSPSSWPVQSPDAFEPPADRMVESKPVFDTASIPSFSEPVAEVAPEVSVSAPSITISGRVQMTISPVADFDKLLSLDSALARIAGVHSVTLADYAREEVVFRVELEKPVSVVEFAHQLSDTAGVATEVTEASESTLSIRIS